MIELWWPVVKIKKCNCLLENNKVTTLTFWGHLTSSATRPFDSRWATFYGWSTDCDHASILHRYGDTARTHGRTLRWFYTLSNAMHCIGQTKTIIYHTFAVIGCFLHNLRVGACCCMYFWVAGCCIVLVVLCICVLSSFSIKLYS